jgi:hypothetical protein
MESTYSIAFEAEPKASDMSLIVKGLAEFDRLQTGGATPEYLLVTVRFQAVPFHEKCGYNVVSRLPDFPPGGARYGLPKDLSGAA